MGDLLLLRHLHPWRFVLISHFPPHAARDPRYIPMVILYVFGNFFLAHKIASKKDEGVAWAGDVTFGLLSCMGFL